MQRRQALGFAHALLVPLQQFFGADGWAVAQHHISHRGFAPLARRHTDHGGFFDLRVLAQHGFQVAGVEVEAAADDHVFAPVHQGQKAFFIKAAHIAGADEAASGGVEPFGFTGFFRLAVVAAHHRPRMADHLAGAARGQLVASFVNQTDVMPFGRLTHGVQFVGVQVGIQDAGAPAFGHAVKLDQAPGPAPDHIGFEHRRKWRAGAELDLKR